MTDPLTGNLPGLQGVQAPALHDAFAGVKTHELSGPGLGKDLMEGAQRMGDLLIDALEGLGKKMVGGAVALGGMAVAAASGVAAKVSSAAVPFKDGFVAMAPGGNTERSPSQGQSRSPEQSASAPGMKTQEISGAEREHNVSEVKPPTFQAQAAQAHVPDGTHVTPMSTPNLVAMAGPSQGAARV